MRVEYRVLGPLEVLLDGEPVAVPAGRGRVLLATLLLRANRFVSVDELVERVWEGAPPDLDRAHKTLQTVVMRLRQALGEANCVRHERGGYLAEIEPEQLDLNRFRSLIELGEFAGALGLWRGPVLANVASESLHRDEVPLIEEERLAAVEKRIEADLADGRSVELVPELQELTRTHPLRDRFWHQLMLALYRSGRQAGALAAYRQVSEMLADELGIDPAPELSALHDQILRGEVAPQEKRVTPRQLPPDLATFAGREKDVERLAASDARVIVISGTGGVGKTSLAVHWAHRVAGRFEDGQIFVNLRGQDEVRAMTPQEALMLVLKGLGAENASGSLDEQVALYRSLVADRKLLLLLDNAASAEQVRPLLPASAGALTVVTSRGDLRGLALNDADLVRLPTLTDEGGMRLLERVLGAARVRAVKEAAAALVRLCGGLPLALRIAAADLRAQDDMSIAGKVARLGEDRLGELEVPGDPAAAVGVVFDQSYAALPEDVRLVLRRLGVLPGADFTAHDAAAISGLPDAGRHLDQLVSVHLVERRGDRFGLHDLLRVYARERCAGEEVDEALERLYDFYRRMTDDAGELLFPDQRRFPLRTTTTQLPDVVLKTSEEAFAWMAAEYPNLFSTVVLAADRGEHWPAHQIGAVLSAYCYELSDLTNWQPLCEIRDRSAQASGEDDLIADANLSHAIFHMYQSNLERARELTDVALELSIRTGGLKAQATAHTLLGGLAGRTGGDGLPHQQQALAIRERMGDREGQAVGLLNIAAALFRRPDLPGTEQALRRALELAGSAVVRLHVHASLAGVLTELGRLPEVIENHEAQQALQAELGNPQPLTIGIIAVARAKLLLGFADEAFDIVLDVLEGLRARSSFEERWDAWEMMADLFDHSGDHDDALAAARILLEAASQADVPQDVAEANHVAARAYRNLGDLDRAAHHLGEMRSDSGASIALCLGDEHAERALLHLALGETEEALRHAEDAVATCRRYHQRFYEARSLEVLAAVRRAAGDVDGAGEAETQAAILYRECGVAERQLTAQ
ncbi:BTAD domain-containing putative transcriptional regulator [Lentzea sp. NPDC051208]|uniref:AfsR/SARP family transcriptional regulator n=1 Tax=Lentzea sp. NPDC051208 TaxID=3154642 RepID=UPI0034498154